MIAAAMILIAAFCKAVADTLDHHFDTSVFKNLNPQFWNPNIDHKTMPEIFNYPLDAWHLFNSAMIIMFIGAVAVHRRWDKKALHWLLEILVGGIIFNLTFNLFYNEILR